MSITKNKKLTIQDICLIGMMVAVIEVCKVALNFLPNIELTTFWLVMFTLFFGKKIIIVVPVFILIEGSIYGFNLWWIMYLYTWPLLVFVTWAFRKQQSAWFWSIFSGAFGLSFGLFCAIPYLVIGTINGGIQNGLYIFFNWWVAGIPWDIVHCIGNFVLMRVLYNPVRNLITKMDKA